MNAQATRWNHSADPSRAYDQGVRRGAVVTIAWCTALITLLVLALLLAQAGA